MDALPRTMPPKKKRKRRRPKPKNPEAGTPGDSSEGEHSASQKPRQSEDEPLGSSQDNVAGQSDLGSVTTQIASSSLQGAVALLPGAQSHGAPPSLPHPDMVFWQETVREWYPHYDKQTYFVPSAFMNRMQLTETQAAGERVLQIDPPVTLPNVPDSLQDKDVREDKAHQKVLDCIQRLQGQTMFVISQLEFTNYLGESAYAPATAMLRRPQDSRLESQNKDQGDFDILIIHKYFGILAGEIKSVGDNFSALKMSKEKQDSILIKKVNEAIKQMEKSRDVLTEIVPMHNNQQPRIKTTLILPNIDKAQLRGALSACEATKTALRKHLGLTGTQDHIPLCLTRDDLEDPIPWWKVIMEPGPEDTATASRDDVYLDLVSRFCGPATTITVHCPSRPKRVLPLGASSSLRSKGNGVAETARRFAPADIMLHPKQVDLLNKSLRLVYIAGPPGTGKTVVLLVKALEWLKQKKPVLVFNMQPDGLAASHMIKAQLEKSTESKIQLLSLDLTQGNDETALSELENKAQDGKLYIIADEALEGTKFRDFCTKLERRMEGLHLWAAGLKHGQAPGSFKEVILTEPLRTPAKVTREVQHSGFMTQGVVMGYTKPPGILPTEGPPRMSLLHRGEEHSAKSLYDCMQCGRDIAEKLKDLGICKPAPEDKSQPGETQTMKAPKKRKISGNGSKTAAKHSLRYGDVFILTMEHALLKTQPGSCSAQTSAQASSCSGLLQGLEESEIPFRVLKVEDSKGIEEVATLSDPDRVVVAQSKTVCGLERPVVVFVQGGKANSDEDAGRLHAMSRSTAQLIWVRYPTPGEI